jgi:hypothetical protein
MAGVYQKTVQSILVHQDGERRSHGFDYRIQQKSAEGVTDASQRNTELLAILEEHLKKVPRTIEGVFDEQASD